MTEKIGLLEGGEVIAVTHLFDESGEPVETWAEAISFVAGPTAVGEWLTGQTRDFKFSRSQ